MTQLALASVDTLPPESLRQKAWSQWFTPPNLARRLVRWTGTPRPGARVLEPSAGAGALVDEIMKHFPMPKVTAIEIDPRYAHDLAESFPTVTVIEGDYLARPKPPELFDFAIENAPYEDGLDGLFLEKTMDESLRVLAVLRLAAVAGQDRYERVWSRIEKHKDGWWMPGLSIFPARPSFVIPGEDPGSAKSDFCCVKLSRVGSPKATRVEWWT